MEGDEVNYRGWLASERCLCCTLMLLPAMAFSAVVSVLILLLLRMVLLTQIMDDGCALVGTIWWYALLVVSPVVFLVVMSVWIVARRGRVLPDFMLEERSPLL
jgi:hypothetical protein